MQGRKRPFINRNYPMVKRRKRPGFYPCAIPTILIRQRSTYPPAFDCAHAEVRRTKSGGLSYGKSKDFGLNLTAMDCYPKE